MRHLRSYVLAAATNSTGSHPRHLHALQQNVDLPRIRTTQWMVDKDRVKGSVEQAKGKAKEWAGKATGDAETEVEGKADQVKVKSKIRSAA
jgi:uncharacterized protein YjbJ (UPF0337 family)